MAKRNWKQKDVEKKSGVSQKTISNILNEEKVPGLDTVEAIADCFGLNLWHMIMPTLVSELESGRNFERLSENYFNASDKGRDMIQLIAEREAEYEKDATNGR